MCGIAGYLDLRGERPPERQILLQMTDALRHRGPVAGGQSVLPTEPYAISKVAAHWYARMYREADGLYISNGILSKDKSPRRGYEREASSAGRQGARPISQQVLS